MATKYATRKLVRNYDTGRMDVIFYDAKTGEILTDLTGYEIIGDGVNPPSDQVSEQDTKKAEEAYSQASEDINIGGSQGEKDSLFSFDGKTSGNEIGILAKLTENIPFVGDFFKKEAAKKSFPDAPAAPTTVENKASPVDPTVTNTGDWAAQVGQSMAFNPDAGPGVGSQYGPRADWLDEGSRNITTNAPTGQAQNWAEQAGMQMMGSVPPDLVDQTQASFAPPGPNVTTDLEGRAPQKAGIIGVSSYNPGANRSLQPSSGIVSEVAGLVSEMYGDKYSVATFSGQEPAGAKPSGSQRHVKGTAVDFDVIDNATGKPAPQSVVDATRQGLAARGYNLGIGNTKGYMEPGRTHVDRAMVSNPAPTAQGQIVEPSTSKPIGLLTGTFWAGTPQEITAAKEARMTGLMPEAYYDAKTVNNPAGVPTPTSAPRGFATATNSIQPPGPSVTQNRGMVSAVSTAAANGVPSSVARDIVERSVTPAEKAGLGFTNRTPAEKATLSQALAGELGPKTLAGLVAGDVQAIEEAKNIMGVLENRAAARQKSINDIATPETINAFMDTKLDTTNKNYNQYKNTLDKVVEDFYTGKIGTPSVPSATHYQNAAIANATWANYAAKKQQVGLHTFYSGVKTKDMSRVEFDLPRIDPEALGVTPSAISTPEVNFDTKSTKSFGAPANQDMSVADQYSSYGQGKTNSASSFGAPANTGMSVADQYSSYGEGKSQASASPSTSSNAGWGGSTVGNANAPNAGGGKTSSTSATGSTSSFGDPANTGMSIGDQYGSYGAGKTSASKSSTEKSSTEKSGSSSGGLGGWGGWI